MAVNKALKYVFFTFNFLFFLAGTCILGKSIHLRSNKADDLVIDNHLPAINLLIFISAVSMILGFLGYCGAISEKSCLLLLFSISLIVTGLLLVVVGLLGATMISISRSEKGWEMAKEHMMQLYPLSEQPEEFQENFQRVEENSFCCGLVNGHLDWGNVTTAPDSCNCTDMSKGCKEVDGREIYSTPCITRFMTWLSRMGGSVIGAAFGFGILVILGCSLCIALIYQINKDSDDEDSLSVI